ncbi:MAG: hypothetical protein EP330_23700 [Deltaproteobacteria bacterium]|nr:MAG: hypothetical protein EP330_23700 [Deltaproteobacteria bacterium]
MRSLLLTCLLSTPAFAGDIVVMTQNQYLGADLTMLAAAPDAGSFNAELVSVLERVAEANAPERIEALADQIHAKDPHFASLQEVFAYTCTDLAPVPPGYGCTDPSIAGAFNDHLALTMDALDAKGGGFVVAGSVTNLDTTSLSVIPGLYGIPFYVNGVPALLNVIDRDVVLARDDVALFGSFGWNYATVATANTPAGPIDFDRGFVAVDAAVGAQPYRFVATHLETRYPDPTNPLAPYIQSAQAYELIATLAGAPNHPASRVVVAGDFNSADVDAPLATPFGTIYPPYMQMWAAGYHDAWAYKPGKAAGYSCCQAEDVANEADGSYERIDLIWTDRAPSRVRANVIGYDEDDKTASGLWPSDHGTVVADITY